MTDATDDKNRAAGGKSGANPKKGAAGRKSGSGRLKSAPKRSASKAASSGPKRPAKPKQTKGQKTVARKAPARKARKRSSPRVTKKKGTKAKASAPSTARTAPATRQASSTRSRRPQTAVRSIAKRAVLPGPKIKRAAKKAPKKATTHEKLVTVEENPTKEGRRPLDGIRVLDLSRLLPGPYASHILASFGAEVIKVEKPGEGDYMREYMPRAQGVNAGFLAMNRGKQSFAVDLKHPDGKAAFLKLVQTADVVLDGFRPTVMPGLGLGHERLRELNPRLIYAALTGYGQTGRRAGRAGHDLNYMALAGMLDLLVDSSDSPLVPGVQLADVAAGALPTIIGILLALQHRTVSDKGQLVDISMFDALLGLMPVQVANYSATKRRPKRGHERLFGRYACYNIYPVRNSRYMAVAALEPKFWAELCNVLERPDLIDDQYVEGDAQEILMAELTRIFQKKEISDWVELFGDLDVCVTEVREISRTVQDEAVAERGMFTPVRGKNGSVYEQLGVFPKLRDTPGYISGNPPARGEHTRRLLESLDYTADQIAALVEGDVIEEPSDEPAA